MTQQIERLSLQNRRISISEIVSELHISRDSVHDVIYNDLHMTKVSW